MARADTPRRRELFLRACEGRLVFGAEMPLALEIFGGALPWRFFAGEDLALDVGGSTAWAAGGADGEELGAFLELCGCGTVILDEAVCDAPRGWRRATTNTIFGLLPGEALPEPEADEALWAALRLDTEPKAGAVADALFAGRSAKRRDDFYSELCSKRARGKATVWALETENGDIASTVGAYAIYAGQAYMACGQTAGPLRGRGAGGRLIVRLANELSSKGYRPVFMCEPERVEFYSRLGFNNMGELARYEKKQKGAAL